jgi:hypothetical protein
MANALRTTTNVFLVLMAVWIVGFLFVEDPDAQVSMLLWLGPVGPVGILLLAVNGAVYTINRKRNSAVRTIGFVQWYLLGLFTVSSIFFVGLEGWFSFANRGIRAEEVLFRSYAAECQSLYEQLRTVPTPEQRFGCYLPQRDPVILPQRYTGKVAFFRYEEGKTNHINRLTYVSGAAECRGELSRYKPMCADSPGNTEVIAVWPVAPRNAAMGEFILPCLTIIHMPTRKCIRELIIRAESTAVHGIPRPGESFLPPRAQVEWKPVHWGQVLKTTAAVTEYFEREPQSLVQ